MSAREGLLLEALGAVIDFSGKRMQLKVIGDGLWMNLSRMAAGHFCMNLLPQNLREWPPLSEKSWIVLEFVKCQVAIAWLG